MHFYEKKTSSNWLKFFLKVHEITSIFTVVEFSATQADKLYPNYFSIEIDLD